MNKNLVLFVAIVLAGIVGYIVIANNVSLKSYIKGDNYTPMNKPSKAWEQSWENERSK